MITEYTKISVRACLPQHKNKPHSELRPASIIQKNTAEKSDQTKKEMIMLCMTGPASVPSKT
jgi:hypothetical protein